MEVTWIITPSPWASMPGSRARSSRTAGNRLMSSSRCHSSSPRAAKPPPGADEPPRTCTIISTPPKRSLTALATVAQPSAVVRSAVTNSSSGRSAGRVRAVVSTCAPSSRKSATAAAPTPLLPPVINTRRPFKFRFISRSPMTGFAYRQAGKRGRVAPGCRGSYRSRSR